MSGYISDLRSDFYLTQVLVIESKKMSYLETSSYKDFGSYKGDTRNL